MPKRSRGASSGCQSPLIAYRRQLLCPWKKHKSPLLSRWLQRGCWRPSPATAAPVQPCCHLWGIQLSLLLHHLYPNTISRHWQWDQLELHACSCSPRPASFIRCEYWESWNKLKILAMVHVKFGSDINFIGFKLWWSTLGFCFGYCGYGFLARCQCRCQLFKISEEPKILDQKKSPKIAHARVLTLLLEG